jgi:ABC-type polysaccharide/polyol phosphate transport system ATPase subunit
MHLKLDNVSVTIPVLEHADRSLRASLIRRVGATVSGSGRRPLINALRDVSLDLVPGSRLAIMGHNGAGKTTLLKVCSGIYEPSKGMISRSGSTASMTDFMMGLDPTLSGYENIYRRAAFMGLSNGEARSLVPEVETFSELGAFLNLPLRTYSTGMFVRLAFAISTSIQPDIMILDEMINAGDMSFMERSTERMERLISQAQILVFASHDLKLLERTCNQAIVLEKGSLGYAGSVADCAAWYKERVQQTPSSVG